MILSSPANHQTTCVYSKELYVPVRAGNLVLTLVIRRFVSVCLQSVGGTASRSLVPHGSSTEGVPARESLGIHPSFLSSKKGVKGSRHDCRVSDTYSGPYLS